MTLEPLQYLLGAFSGALVGFVLGLVGGGGSILAVPLMVYLVRVRDPHVAIGTSALAVAANAAFGLFSHHRIGNVKWRCALVFAVSGIVGAAIGSTLGKAFDGQKLLFLFALVMIIVGVLMLRRRGHVGAAGVRLGKENAAKLVLFGFGTGLFSGFFGIGGGFLIGPALIAATGMPMLMAVGSSLVAVTAFGLTTAVNYALSGFVDWPLASLFIAGGFLGSFGGTRAAKALSGKGRLTALFAGLIFVVAAYM
ncbi:MAG TPA: sulfite exporter TauE/SafE family protein, partial [Sphingomicrobium sp.]|nr:sulfite exporter TauE/SafE family protein [Sphingomicrobium sp.]